MKHKANWLESKKHNEQANREHRKRKPTAMNGRTTYTVRTDWEWETQGEQKIGEDTWDNKLPKYNRN